jgi:hypothetical protein
MCGRVTRPTRLHHEKAYFTRSTNAHYGAIVWIEREARLVLRRPAQRLQRRAADDKIRTTAKSIETLRSGHSARRLLSLHRRGRSDGHL